MTNTNAPLGSKDNPVVGVPLADLPPGYSSKILGRSIDLTEEQKSAIPGRNEEFLKAHPDFAKTVLGSGG